MAQTVQEQLYELTEKVHELTQTLETINKKINKIDELPYFVEQIITQTFKKYLIFPDDYTTTSKEKQRSSSSRSMISSSKSHLSSQQIQSNQHHSFQKDQSFSENKELKEMKESKEIKDDKRKSKINEKKKDSIELIELPDKQMAFTMQNENVICYDRKGIVVELSDPPKQLIEIPNLLVNDMSMKSDGSLLIATDNNIIICKDNSIEKLNISAKSCCEFAGQIVSVCGHGLNYTINGETKNIKKLSAKIELVSPNKIRASGDNLFINDNSTNILTVLNTSFKLTRAVNSTKAIDFCVLSNTHIALMLERMIRIINIAEKTLFTEREIRLDFDGEKINAIRIEYVDKGDDSYFLLLGSNCKQVYKISLSMFKVSQKKN